MTEWLNQYEKVAQRQQLYLQKIRDLRQRLQTKDERYMMLSIERMRKLPPLDPDTLPYSYSFKNSGDYKSHVPWSSSLLAHNFYPKLSSPTSLHLMEPVDVTSSMPGRYSSSPDSLSTERGGGAYKCIVAGERLVPKLHPRRLGPLHRQRAGDAAGRRAISERSGNNKVDPNLTLERNKTDYEPIEDIAKRNRIQFSRYLDGPDKGKDETSQTPAKGANSQQPPSKGVAKNGNSGGAVAKDAGGYIAGRSNLSTVANPGDLSKRDV